MVLCLEMPFEGFLKVFGDGSVCEVIHFINHADSRFYNGICTDSSRAFSES